MALVASANAVGSAIASALNVTDAESVANYQTIVTQIYTGIVAHLTAIVPPASIVTVGSATTQTGPASPVPCTLN